MRRYFLFGEFNSWYDWRCTLTAKSIPEAEPKYNYIELGGAHGTIDATEALTGEVAYSDRILTASFMCSDGTYAEREALLRRIAAQLHGRKVQIIEPDDQDHYFLGRVKVTNVQKFQTYMTFTLEATCDPWRYATVETRHMVEVSSGAATVAELPGVSASTRAATTVANGNCGKSGSNLKWVLDSNGVLTISGTGDMADYTVTSAPGWKSYASSITAAEIGEGVTALGKYAFYGLKQLSGVTISGSVTALRDGAMAQCSSLTRVTLGQGVYSIGSTVFSVCTSLASLTIPASVRVIGSQAFYNCTSLTEVYFLGNAPTVEPKSASQPTFSSTVTLFYSPGTSGWTSGDAYDASTGKWNGYTIQEATATCGHSRTTTTTTKNGNGTHTVTVTCSDCGATVSTTTNDCTDGNSDHKCDVCGAALACDHTNTATTTTQNGNGTHTVTVTCSDCGATISSTTEACTNVNNDGKCDVCGAVMSCAHTNTDTVYTDLGGSHSVKTVCTDCGAVLSTHHETCLYDGTGHCSACGGKIACAHVVTTTTYAFNGNGTHTVTTTCDVCGEVLSTHAEACTDLGDGKCHYCGGEVMEVMVMLHNNGVKTLTPEVHVVGSVLLSFDGAFTELETGAYKITELKLRQGANVVRATGTGTVEFIYREATL